MRQQVWVAGVVGMALMLHGSVWTGRLAAQGGGLGHALVVTPSGAVWAWGYNAEAQLGDNTRISRRIPTAVAGMGTVTAVAAGGSHSLALDSAGRVWAWGDNNLGAVGDGTTVDKLLPTQLALLNVVKFAAGANHSLALRSNGDLYVWGKNTDSQLGLGTTTQQNSPVLLMSGVADIAAGGRHSAIVKTDGTAWAFGYNFNGQLGDGTTTLRSTPVQMSGVSSAVAVAAGSSHTLIRRSDGTLLAAGLNFYGQIGDGTTTQRTTAVSVTGVTGAVEIAAGDNHSFARLADGTVKAWGANSTGSLGDGTTTMRTSAVTVTGLPAVSGVRSGGTFGVAVTTSGVVYTWGSNAYGEQGDGTINTNALVPHAISGASFDWNVATPTLNVASGTYFVNQTVTVMNVMAGVSMHYTTTGVDPTQADAPIASGSVINVQSSQVVKVKAWKAGMPASDTAVRDYVLKVSGTTFSPVGNLYTTPKTVTLSTPTAGASLYYTVDGSTPTAGSALYTAPITIGTGTVLKVVGVKTGWANSNESVATYTFNFGALPTPTIDPGAGPFTSSVDVTMASSQSGATVRYTTNGSTPTTTSTAYTGPVVISASGTVKAKAFHPDYTASAETARTYTLVTATPTFSLTPGTYAAGTAVVVSTSTPGASISYSTDGAAPTPSHPTLTSGDAVIVGDGTLKAMAWKAGQTNSGAASAAYSVTGHLTAPGVAGGGSHSVALRSDGTVFAWGRNAGRELADGTATMRLQPVVTGGVTGATAISVGDGFTLARLVDGRVVGWGANGFSQLGDGTTTNPRPWPVFATGITSAVAVDAGTSHALALLTDGTVVGWGQNNAGQVGDGSTTGRTVPTPVTGVTNAVAVSAGSGFSLAVTADGTAWSWGGNGNGQLGTGNTAARSTPGTVPGLTNVRAVAAGTFTSYFLMADGTVRAAGSNAGGAGAGGALGNGTSGGQSTTPVTVSSLTNVVQIAAGSAHGLALKSDRTVWAWGNGGTGQIGNGATSDVTTPVQVAGLPAIVAIGAGATHSLALGLDGSVWAWGANSQGQLGDGSQTARLVPVQVTMPGTGWTLPPPTLTSLTPTAGPVATSVTLTGTDFGVAQSTSTVSFNGTAATPTAWSPTSITTAVPAGASSGPVTVTVGTQPSNTLLFTTASPPTLTAVSPGAGPVGIAVTLTGTNFGSAQGASTVSFNGTAAMPIAWSATSITAPVPPGAASGPVTVTVGGTASNGVVFTVVPPPTLTALSPTSGVVGVLVTLSGTDFGATQGASVVAFNGTPATPTAWSTTSITAPVPAGASSGPVTVTVGGQLSNSVGFTVISPPTLTATTPNAGPAGALVTLTGANFGPTQGTSTVLFNGTVAVPAAWSPTSITTPVPAGATSGVVTVVVGGLTSNGVGFTVGAPTTTTAVTITDPFPGTTFNAPASLTVSAAASISGGTIARVEFYDGPLLIGTASAPPYSVAWVAPVEGPHDLTAVAVDQSSTTTVSPLVSVTIAPAGGTLGTLATPVATPGAGVYAPGIMVSLSAAPGSEVRYTRNGGTPTSTSPVFVAPLTVSSTETIRARAFRAGWTESAEMVAAYQVDTTPPTIVATVSPAPNEGGWHRSPVTVSFTCDDAQPVAACPAPIVVNSEGTNLLVSGTATDAAGNQASTSVTLDIDLTAPTVGITSPTSNDIFTPGPAAITATVFDGLSDIQNATCNGVAAVVANGALDCLVSLPPGPTTVVVHVSDAAGNGASRSLKLNSNSPRTALVISPKRRTLLVGDTYDIRVVDQLGRLVGDASLTTTDPLVATATLIEPGQPALLEALGPGSATITATAGALTADLAVTVLAGTTLPVGSPVWTFNTPDQAGVAAQLSARDSTEAEVLVATGQAFGPNTLMHGLNAAGEIVHTEVGPFPASVPTVGDSSWVPSSDTLGGYLSVAGTPRDPSGFVVRRNAFSGQGLSWEYHSAPNISPIWQVLRHSQAPDGTLYLVEESPITNSILDVNRQAFVVVLDGATGQVRSRVALPASNYCLSDLTTGIRRNVPLLPYYSITPFVGRDGAAYMVVATQKSTCGSGVGDSRVWLQGAALDLVRIAPNGSDTVIRVRGYEQLVCGAANCVQPTRGFGFRSDLTPDGTGAILFKGVDSYFETALQQSIETEFVYRHGPTSSGEVAHALSVAPVVLVGKSLMYSLSLGSLAAHEPSNGATQWTVGIAENEKPISVRADGGVVLYDPSTGQMSQVDGTGTRQPAEQLPLAWQVFQTSVGEVVGSTFTPDWSTYLGVAKVVTSDLTDHTVYPTATGGRADRPRGRFGVFVKAHFVKEVPGNYFKHASVRIVPSSQDMWAQRFSAYANNSLDPHGNLRVTYGAGPGDGTDAGGCFQGALTADANRASDKAAFAVELRRLKYADGAEDALIQAVLDRADYFRDNSNGVLPYKCVPEPFPGAFNSNSFVKGLLDAIPVEASGANPLRYLEFPGWVKPVPPAYFGVTP